MDISCITKAKDLIKGVFPCANHSNVPSVNKYDLELQFKLKYRQHGQKAKDSKTFKLWVLKIQINLV